MQRFGEIVSDALDAEDPLSSLLELLAELNHHDPSWYLISTKYTLHAIRNPDTAKVLAEHDKQLRDELTELLRLLLKKSGHKTDVDLDMVARVTVAIHEGGLAQTLVEQDALASGVRSDPPAHRAARSFPRRRTHSCHRRKAPTRGDLTRKLRRVAARGYGRVSSSG